MIASKQEPKFKELNIRGNPYVNQNHFLSCYWQKYVTKSSVSCNSTNLYVAYCLN